MPRLFQDVGQNPEGFFFGGFFMQKVVESKSGI